jgi:tetratricopeptide (TPR) repeat protein
MQELKRAEELDPLSPIIATDQGVALYMARHFDAAIEQLQKTLELYPNYEEAQRWLASSYQATKQFDKALAVLESGELSDQTPAKMVLRAGVYARAGRHREALDLLRKIEKQSSRQFVDPAAVGCIYIGLGRYNEGLTLIEKGVLVHSTALTSLKVNPFYDPLRGDARFQALLHAVHLDK